MDQAKKRDAWWKTEFGQAVKTSKEYKIHDGVHVNNEENIYIAENYDRHNKNDLKQKEGETCK